VNGDKEKANGLKRYCYDIWINSDGGIEREINGKGTRKLTTTDPAGR